MQHAWGRIQKSSFQLEEIRLQGQKHKRFVSHVQLELNAKSGSRSLAPQTAYGVPSIIVRRRIFKGGRRRELRDVLVDRRVFAGRTKRSS
jgi:hypothetical protein